MGEQDTMISRPLNIDKAPQFRSQEINQQGMCKT